MIGNVRRSTRPICAISEDLLGRENKLSPQRTSGDGVYGNRWVPKSASRCLFSLVSDEIRSRFAEDVLNRLTSVERQVSKRFTLVFSTENDPEPFGNILPNGSR